MRANGPNSLKAVKFGSFRESESATCMNQSERGFSDEHIHFCFSSPNAGCFQFDGPRSRGSFPNGVDFNKHDTFRPQLHKFSSIDEVVGRIYCLAKDQHGCRFLQRKFTEGTAGDIENIFLEIIDRVVELMTDPFGNYLVQKLLEVCDENQLMQILHAVTRRAGVLVRISCDMHGTRAVQKIIETLNTPEHFSLLMNSLKPGVVTLIKNMNGNHVAQCCLQYLMPEYREFLFEAATSHCVELATDRHGCCVLQKCLTHSDGEPRHHLICEVSSNALILSQDPFGNYVVQFVFELGLPWATNDVLDELEGNFADLSMQKYSSNVVEKCLKYAGEERRPRIIQELISNPRLDQIMQDPYGNYVIQAALSDSEGALHDVLVEAIKPHVSALRTSPYGKKVLKP
ncbi:Pumilio RNA-binding repeat [Dillenia turbinata]|uniref:Pumilio RNA-binding repeat n=1 Tax=Dillenia turbinata TaxID=194707 RepID=A0AAN8ZK23_9MAGN